MTRWESLGSQKTYLGSNCGARSAFSPSCTAGFMLEPSKWRSKSWCLCLPDSPLLPSVCLRLECKVSFWFILCVSVSSPMVCVPHHAEDCCILRTPALASNLCTTAHTLSTYSTPWTVSTRSLWDVAFLTGTQRRRPQRLTRRSIQAWLSCCV